MYFLSVLVTYHTEWKSADFESVIGNSMQVKLRESHFNDLNIGEVLQ